MSPEYRSWQEVPKQLKKKVVVKEDFEVSMPHKGFVFLLHEGEVKKMIFLSQAKPGIIDDARKEKSPWHLVRGFNNTSKTKKALDQKRCAEVSSDDAGFFKRGYSKKEYRGNHRSHTRGRYKGKNCFLLTNG